MEVCEKETLRAQGKRVRRRKPVPELCFVIALFLGLWARGQDGDAGINQANTMIRDYFNTGVNLLYAVGGILGLIGAVKVYQKWSHGDHDTSKVAASWFGSCIFLVVVGHFITKLFWVMRTGVYTINKGVNRPVEFRGLKAQYIWWLGGGIAGVVLLFAILYISGVNPFLCLGIAGVMGLALFRQVYKMSRTYGQYGLMKKRAARLVPRRVVMRTKKTFLLWKES